MYILHYNYRILVILLSSIRQSSSLQYFPMNHFNGAQRSSSWEAFESILKIKNKHRVIPIVSSYMINESLFP